VSKAKPIKPTKDVALAPVGIFKTAAQVVFSNSKQKSDEQLGEGHFTVLPLLTMTGLHAKPAV
jgi:hypothetical protein